MNIWFIRCNGETAHNQPGTSRYMVNEPPKFPNRKFNYKEDCLQKGFVRVGFPAAGDLRDPNWRSHATAAYGSMMKAYHFGYLEKFASINSSDIVLLPTYQWRYQIHLGVVIPPRREPDQDAPSHAYYYYFDISTGDWFDNAHRVDVEWAKVSNGTFSSFEIPEISVTWIRAFGQVKSGSQRIIQLARDSGLLR